jgi:NADPH-dependent 2,4-dienoyl-CoA reductase/sulfur reductase-like enzyme
VIPGASAEVAVVGGGPAGMAAALAAADLGCRVALVDAYPLLGGQVHRQPWSYLGPGKAVVEALPGRFRALASHPGIRLHLGASVWHARQVAGGFELLLTTGEVIHAGSVVVATGALELVLPFPGWDLPGAITAGAAQALLKGQGRLAGRRVVVAGSGPFLLPVAAGLARAGATVVAVAEASRLRPGLLARPGVLRGLASSPAKLAEGAAYLSPLLRRRVPLLAGWAVTACRGGSQVEEVRLSRLLPGWAGWDRERWVQADTCCVGYGFVPSVELARSLGCEERVHASLPTSAVVVGSDQSTAKQGVFAAGEVTGISGAAAAELEGLLAGRAAARWSGRGDRPEPSTASVRRRLARERAFARALERVGGIGAGWTAWLEEGTPVCRCEESPWGKVKQAVQSGAGDLRGVKGLSRAGMGYCQGRVCGPALALAVAALSGKGLAEVGDLATRSIAWPVPMGTIARGTGAP